jgi:uncharacterized membrane protein YphA (DoxX/SURF4 family)
MTRTATPASTTASAARSEPQKTAGFWQRNGAETTALLGRWLLGGLFVYMGMNKALHPVDFLKLVHQYDLTTVPWLLNSIAAALPWFEVFCGLLLITGVAVRGSALMLVLMLIPFTIVVFKRALDISAAQNLPFCAIKFDCGCGTGEVLICRKLPENCLLILLACWLLTGRGRRLAARFSLFTLDPSRREN